MTNKILMEAMNGATFRKMEEMDYEAFGGAGDNALIADNQEYYTVVLDGSYISVIVNDTGEEFQFTISDVV